VNMSLILPWFPIILGVGVGGRLLDRTRGFALGVLCALFWILLVQASAGPDIWWDAWSIAGILAGAAAIVAMGGWAGEAHFSPPSRQTPAALPISTQAGRPRDEQTALDRLVRVMDRFDDWLETHRNESNPWPRFDEFIRTALYDGCGATHVRPYRLLSDTEELISLRDPSPWNEVRHLSARRGIVGHVVTTGRAYVAGDLGQGELVRKLAEESDERAAWCFAVKHGTARLGAVVVGELTVSPHQNGALLHAMERLATRFWCELDEVNQSRAAALDDPVSHLYSREAFLRAAESSLQESYSQAEPVALGVIALEGLRELNDTGRWEIADELVGGLARSLRRKVRLDDCLGRFDGSRFVVLLRRVDSELASLIIGQIMSRLSAVCDDRARWRAAVRVRCGVVGSGTDQPELRALVARALAECRRAREEGTVVACDLGGVRLESGNRT